MVIVPALERTPVNEQFRASVEPPTPPASSVDDASYLRGLLEKQPSCLLRVSRDGVLLACNDVGLSLFGKATLAEVLEGPITAFLTFDLAEAWSDFSDRVWESGAGSLECELATTDSSLRTVLLQAVALHDHPDSLESLLVSARDTTKQHRIETLLHDEGAQQRLAEVQARLDDALTAQAVQATEIARLKDLSEQYQVGRLQQDEGANPRVADLERQVASLEAERERLATARAADREEVERLLGEVALNRNAIDKALDDQRVELQEWRSVALDLEPLAAVGRLAGPLSDDLRRILGKLNERAASLLTVFQGDAIYRPEIEALRAEAMRAMSLVRQLSRSPLEPHPGQEMH
jgi:hypothetical protein